MKYVLYRFPDAITTESREMEDRENARQRRAWKARNGTGGDVEKSTGRRRERPIKWEYADMQPYLKEGYTYPLRGEIVSVIYDDEVDDLTEALMQAVSDELSASGEYAGCEVSVFPPDHECWNVSVMSNKDFLWEIAGVVSDPSKPYNDMIYFGVERREQ